MKFKHPFYPEWLARHYAIVSAFGQHFGTALYLVNYKLYMYNSLKTVITHLNIIFQL